MELAYFWLHKPKNKEMYRKTIGIWLATLVMMAGLSSCDILQQLAQADQLKQGTASVIKGDNSLPGAQKNAFSISQEGYNPPVNPNGTRYKDHIFQNVKKTHETYATGVKQFNGQTTNLMMDIYTPVGDNAKKRPVVIFVFGGGWFMKTLDGMPQFGKAFAMKGFVSVSVDYRIGFHQGTGMMKCKTNYKGFENAWYRGAQDVKAAIRYLKANADRLGIDKNKIFIGGHSAGGFTTVNAVHLDDADVPQLLKDQEGSVNSIGGHQNENTKVAGMYALASGAMYDLKYVDKNVPTFLLMGTCDEFLNNGNGTFYKCGNNPKTFTGPALANKLKGNGACVELAVCCGGNHSFDGVGQKKQIQYVSDFIYKTLKGSCKSKQYTVSTTKPKANCATDPMCR